MSTHRLLAAAVAFTWLLPSMVTGGVALHVAFDHPVVHSHEESTAAVALRALAGQGQLSSASQRPHEHSTVADGDRVAIRRGFDAAAQPSMVAAAEISAPWIDYGADAPAGKVLAGPPKASGPPLLACLATFRI